MRNKRYIGFFVFILLIAIVGCSKQENKFTALIRSSTTSVSVGDTVIIQGILKNEGPETSVIGGPNLFQYSITDEKGELVKQVSEVTVAQLFKIQENGQYESGYETKFEKPGTYNVKSTVKFKVKGKKSENKIQTNEIQIVVK